MSLKTIPDALLPPLRMRRIVIGSTVCIQNELLKLPNKKGTQTTQLRDK